MKNRFVVGILFLVIAAASFMAWLWLTNNFAPPEVTVFIALNDIDPGETLSPEKVTSILIRIDNPSPYITADEIETYGFRPVVQRIGAGEMITKSSISLEGNPASANRVALSLGDPNLAAMAIPVNPEIIPERIVIGDRVRISGSFGSATFLTGVLEPAPTGLPFDNSQLFTDPESLVGQLPTPTAQNITNLPVAKTIVFDTRVLQVVYEREFSPSTSSDDNGSGFVDGDIRSIVVAVPVDMIEPLTFLINNSFLSIAVLDPNAEDMTGELSPGISWNDFAEFFETQRVLWSLTPQPDNVLLLGGADVVGPTVIAPYQPTPEE